MSFSRFHKGALPAFLGLLFALAVALAAAPARAGSGSGTLAGDTSVNAAAAAINNNLGGSHGMMVGTNGQAGGIMHGLLRFNMPGGLTGRVTVTSTQLQLTLEGVGSSLNCPGAMCTQTAGTAATYSLFRITQDWAEGTGAADVNTTFVIGQPCAGAAASWNQANCGSAIAWSTPGGTAFGSASAAQSSTGLGINGVLTFTSAACAGTNLSCDVQSWIDSGNPFGWLIVSSSAATSQVQKFFTKESGTSPPSLTFNFSCNAGFKDLGASCTTCTDAANTDCIISHVAPAANRCNDAGPPSLTYSCTCDPSVYKNGTGSDGKPACVVGCSPTNHCRDNGDAAAACTDTATGYSCACDAGFVLNSTGTSCVSACPGTPDPCGAGKGACTAVAGGWTCACNTGYVSTGGARPSCVDFNACTAAAINDCTTFPGNMCVDEVPPSVTYHCTCGNPAMTTGLGADGKPACVDINDCAPNHCRDGGDSGAVCTDRGGIIVGYTCACSTTFWTAGVVGGFNSCVDKNECATSNPCGVNGVCTNVALGGGYSCTCNTGYFSSMGMSPTCVRPTMCDGPSLLACVTNKPGNSCALKPAPSLAHTCTCNNAAYVASTDGASCVLKGKDPCKVNHCIDRGDQGASCVERAAPASGYDCRCSAGWRFDGTACADIDECLAGGNPCDRGTCNNFQGGYSCNCESGYHSNGALAPTCVANVTTTGLQVTTSGGSGCACSITSAGTASTDPRAPLSPLLLLGVAFFLLALARRRARR